MDLKSNVVIKSNIYVNKSKSQYDKDFVSQVRGYEALKKINALLGSLHSGLLTKAQRDEYSQGTPDCYCDKSGTKPWGLIIENNTSVFVCKCEKVDCKGHGNHKGYADCSKYTNFRRVERLGGSEALVKEKQYIAPDFGLLRYLDSEEKIIYLDTLQITKEQYDSHEIIVIPQTPEITETKPVVSLEMEVVKRGNETSLPKPMKTAPVIQPKDIKSLAAEYRKIDKPDEIIKAKIEERIIVNAGPGTGKTYSVIKKLGYILINELADPINVLVLCYSRSAVGVIKKRIEEEIRDGIIPVEATRLYGGIRTFDEFATYLLADDEFEGTLNNLNYDERIEKFIAGIKKDNTVFDGLEYLIVDEMQDLVGVRARMVKRILEQVNCGFLLLGDMCQSIYDYEIKDDNELNSYRFYQWLNTKFNIDETRLELTKNVRQKEELSMFTDYMRKSILSEDINQQSEALALCVDTLRQENYMGCISKLEQNNLSSRSAILCRNNAEVSIISTELFANNIEHRILKRAQHVDLVPWIAEILSTYIENRIGITAFRKRVLEAGYEDADAKWLLLKNVAKDEEENVLDVKLLVKNLVAGRDLPPELDLANGEAIAVSTIHRAKGREYDKVILITEDYDINNNALDEIKVAYVALTRAKEQIGFCEIPHYYIKQLDSKRWIATGRSYKNGKLFCSHFEIGLDGDINPYGFVNKTIDDVTTTQKYIGKLKPGDLLEVWKIDRVYTIFHQGVYIGMLFSQVPSDLKDAMKKTNNSPNLPNHFSGVYVNNIVTIANTRFNEVIAKPYNKSGLWLGVEISGFAKTDWS